MLRAVVFLLLVHCWVVAAQAQPASETASLAGTVWAGTIKAPDSLGKLKDYQYTFQLLNGNRLRWYWEGSDFTNGTWRQTGNAIRMELNDGYSTWLGTFDGNQMNGNATNKLGHKWSWVLTRQTGFLGPGSEKSGSWVTYSSTLGRFKALLPAEPEVREQPVETPVGKLTNHVFLSRTGDAVMVIAYSDYPQSAEDPQAVLDRVRDGTVKGIGGTLISSEAITLGGVPGREYQASTATLKYISRIFLVNRRLYQMAAVGAPGDLSAEAVKKFLDGFELMPSQ